MSKVIPDRQFPKIDYHWLEREPLYGPWHEPHYYLSLRKPKPPDKFKETHYDPDTIKRRDDARDDAKSWTDRNAY